jgi:hypothetical protein
MLLLLHLLACDKPLAEVDSGAAPAGDRGDEAGDDTASDAGDTGGDTAGDTGDTAHSGDTDTGPPSEYIYDEDESPPLLDLEAVGAAVEEALQWMAAADPGLILGAWQIAEGWADSRCPAYDPYYEQHSGYWYWVDSCDTSDGAHFDGNFYGQIYEPFSDRTYSYWDYGYLAGDAWAVSPEGEELRVAGDLYMYKTSAHDFDSKGSYVRWIGDASWSGPTYAGTWLEETISFDLELTASNYAGTVNLVAEGGVSGLPGAFQALVLDAVYVYTPECALEPGGISGARTPTASGISSSSTARASSPAASPGTATAAASCGIAGPTWGTSARRWTS